MHKNYSQQEWGRKRPPLSGIGVIWRVATCLVIPLFVIEALVWIFERLFS